MLKMHASVCSFLKVILVRIIELIVKHKLPPILKQAHILIIIKLKVLIHPIQHAALAELIIAG